MVTPHIHWRAWTNPDYIGAFCPIETDTVLKITGIEKKMVKGPDGKESECTIANVEQSKPMILNKINRKTLTKLYGTAFIDEWVGRSFIVFPTKTNSFGEKDVDCLRIRSYLPKSNEPEIDYSFQIEQLESCQTLEQLQATFLAFTASEKSATVKTKDAMKTKLTNRDENKLL